MNLNTFLATTVLTAGIGLSAANAAKADIFNFSYDIGGYTGHGQFDATLYIPDTGSYGTYQITNVIGLANGEVITGLDLGHYGSSNNFLFYYKTQDQVPLVDFSGVSFNTNSNSYNIYGYGGTGSPIVYGAIDRLSNPDGSFTDLTGSLNVSLAAPEMSTWAMFGLGFIGLGLVGAKRRVVAA